MWGHPLFLVQDGRAGPVPQAVSMLPVLRPESWWAASPCSHGSAEKRVGIPASSASQGRPPPTFILHTWPQLTVRSPSSGASRGFSSQHSPGAEERPMRAPRLLLFFLTRTACLVLVETELCPQLSGPSSSSLVPSSPVQALMKTSF